MSIKVMSRVWEKSHQKGSALLCLLALADWSDDDGVSWYGINKLQNKLRLSERETQRLVKALTETNELFVAWNGGPKGTNLYIVTTAADESELQSTLNRRNVTEVQASQILGRGDIMPGVTKHARKMRKMSPDPLIDPSVNTNTDHANIANANSREQSQIPENSVAPENKNVDDTLKPSAATPLPLVTSEPEDKPDSVHTESAEPSAPPKTWSVGDKVRYTTRGGWGGGIDIHCIAQVLKVNKTKITVVVYNQKTASPQEVSVSPSHLTARETDYACDEQIAAYIAKKNEPKDKLPPTYGDLFVAYRDLIYRGDANSPKTTQMRVGKDAKLLLESYPDTDAIELKDFVTEWKARKSGADIPRGTKLVDWYVVYRKEWKKIKPASEQVTYVTVPIDMTVSGSEAL